MAQHSPAYIAVLLDVVCGVGPCISGGVAKAGAEFVAPRKRAEEWYVGRGCMITAYLVCSVDVHVGRQEAQHSGPDSHQVWLTLVRALSTQVLPSLGYYVAGPVACGFVCVCFCVCLCVLQQNSAAHLPCFTS